MFSGECLLAFCVCAALFFPEVTAMKHTSEKVTEFEYETLSSRFSISLLRV